MSMHILHEPIESKKLADVLGLVHRGQSRSIQGVSSLEHVTNGALCFSTPYLLINWELLDGSVVFVSDQLRLTLSPHFSIIETDNPRLAFVKALIYLKQNCFFEDEAELRLTNIHPSALVHPRAVVGQGCKIGAGSQIGPFTDIEDGTIIGEYCRISSHAHVGGIGFGFERDIDGTPLRMPHLGHVIIGDGVEIGSFTTVCRGTLENTIIEDDAKIDDHVHVAHNVIIRKKAMVIACAELSGGVEVGEEAWVGPNASVLEHVKLGKRSLVGLGAVVLRDVPDGATVVGNPARILEKKS